LKASYPEFWFQSEDGSGSGVRPFFPHLYEWSVEMQDTIAKYDVVYKKAIVIFNEITMLKGRRRDKKLRRYGIEREMPPNLLD